MPNVQLFVRDSTNNKNVALQVDGSNKLSVNDATAQLSLSSINSALGGTLTVSDSTAQSSLSSINLALGGTLTTSNLTAEGSLANIESSVAGTLTVSDSTAQSSLSNIESSVSGTLTVSDSTAQSTLSNIHTALSGTLTTSSGVSRTNGNIRVAQSVVNGDVSSAVDANNFKNARMPPPPAKPIRPPYAFLSTPKSFSILKNSSSVISSFKSSKPSNAVPGIIACKLFNSPSGASLPPAKGTLMLSLSSANK